MAKYGFDGRTRKEKRARRSRLETVSRVWFTFARQMRTWKGAIIEHRLFSKWETSREPEPRRWPEMARAAGNRTGVEEDDVMFDDDLLANTQDDLTDVQRLPQGWRPPIFVKAKECEAGTGPGKNSVTVANSCETVLDNKLRETLWSTGQRPKPVENEKTYSFGSTIPLQVYEDEKKIEKEKATESPVDRLPWAKTSSAYKKTEEEYESCLEEIRNTVDRNRRVVLQLRSLDLFKDLKRWADTIWQMFQKLLFPSCVPTETYNKSEMDNAMEDCFGSMRKEGTLIFSWGKNEIKLDDVNEIHRVFSLYLARKSVCPKSAEEIPEAVRAFALRIMNPAPENEDREKAKRIFAQLVDLLFDKESLEEFKRNVPDAPTHASGCLERPRSKGGKREAFYGEDLADNYDVKPVGISTGGKIRVITVDSAKNMKYAYLNKYMAQRIRGCSWSVFGREVKEWLKDKTFEGEVVSGDLESATDLFSGNFADLAIARLVEIDPDLDEDDAFRMRSFTTRAKFTFEDAALIQELKDSFGGEFWQERGQLMGSILSFPLLCLVSLTAFLMSRDDLVRGIFCSGKKSENLKFLRTIKDVGVNGDDIVFSCKDRGAGWARGVAAIGGKVSRGKSLVSNKVFTVNSELWVRVNGSWTPPGALRLSLLTGICAGRKVSPALSWEHLMNGGIELPEELTELIKDRWNMRLPPSMGGVGLVKEFRVFENLVARVILESKRRMRIVRPAKAWADWTGDTMKKVKVLVPASEMGVIRKWTSVVEETAGRPSWADKGKVQKTRTEALSDARQQLKYTTKGEIAEMRRQWEWEWKMFESGLKRAIVPEVPWIMEQAKPLRKSRFEHVKDSTKPSVSYQDYSDPAEPSTYTAYVPTPTEERRRSLIYQSTTFHATENGFLETTRQAYPETDEKKNENIKIKVMIWGRKLF
jgi:hypothetical protein